LAHPYPVLCPPALLFAHFSPPHPDPTVLVTLSTSSTLRLDLHRPSLPFTHTLASTMSCTSSQLFALLAIALFSIPTILAACNCRPGYSCDRDIFGQTSCSLLPCNPGNFSPGGGASCQPCVPGTFAVNTGSAACTACAPGTFSRLSSSIFCGSATAGNYAPSAGSIDQIPCPAGSYQNLNGQTSCTLCPCGSYASLPGSAVCSPCGKYRD